MVEIGKTIVEEKEQGAYVKVNRKKTKYNYIDLTHRNCSEVILENGEPKCKYRGQLNGFKIARGNEEQFIEYEGKIYSPSDYTRLISEKDKKNAVPANEINGCGLVLLISCYNELIDGSPKLIKVDINCNSDNSEEFKVTLSSKVQEDTYQINELILKFLGYGKNETSSAFPLDDHWTSSYLGYRKITMPIKSFVDNTTPGW